MLYWYFASTKVQILTQKIATPPQSRNEQQRDRIVKLQAELQGHEGEAVELQVRSQFTGFTSSLLVLY